jgi:hypothetical protein
MKNQQKFLDFNGKNIVFLSVDGTYWIALKPICEALNIEYTRSFKNAKTDPILGPALAVQPMQVSKNGKSQVRNVTCIPEEFVYGWIFSINSESEELTEYKRTCYRLLYNHFHGTITNRKELLLTRKDVDSEIGHITRELQDNEEKFKRLKQLQVQKKLLNKQLNTIDKELVKEPELF